MEGAQGGLELPRFGFTDPPFKSSSTSNTRIEEEKEHRVNPGLFSTHTHLGPEGDLNMLVQIILALYKYQLSNCLHDAVEGWTMVFFFVQFTVR